MLIRIIGRYLDGSVLFSLPGFVIGKSFAVFHGFEQRPLFRHWEYISVISPGNLLNAHRKVARVMPPIAGAFLPFKLSGVYFTSP